MVEGRSVSVAEVVDHFGLEVLTANRDGLGDRKVTSADVVRPGAQWAGPGEAHADQRLAIIGRGEVESLWGLPLDDQQRRFEGYCAASLPGAVFTRGLDVPTWAVRLAESRGVPLLRTVDSTPDFFGALTGYLALALAARTVMHAGLVDVYGEGVLILGRSGVGKSETALELIRRGHMMIADDTVEIRRPSDRELIGRAPGLMRHFMEIKGIGIVNLRRMYGIGAVKSSSEIQLVVALEPWDPERDRDDDQPESRESTVEILGVQVPSLTIPVQPGRNTAGLIEAAAVAHRAREMAGYVQRGGTQSAADLFGRVP